MPPTKSPVDQRVVGQIIETLDSPLGGGAGRRRDAVETGGARDVDPAVDGVDP